jgi:hypothetical protein
VSDYLPCRVAVPVERWATGTDVSADVMGWLAYRYHGVATMQVAPTTPAGHPQPTEGAPVFTDSRDYVRDCSVTTTVDRTYWTVLAVLAAEGWAAAWRACQLADAWELARSVLQDAPRPPD